MQLQSKNWSVVLVGRWNSAILTPAGIAKHIFGLEGKPLPIAVPLDGFSPYIVSNPGETLSVRVEDNRVVIDITKSSFTDMEAGLACGVNALKNLPVTPISGVGFNLNFSANESAPEIISSTGCVIDKNISDQLLTITERIIQRSIKFGEGQLNLNIKLPSKGASVNCNFHMGTTDVEKAKKWLTMPMVEIKEILGKIEKIVGVTLQEGNHEHGDKPNP